MRQRNKISRNPICKCGNPKERVDQGYCNECRNKWSRNKRKAHYELSESQRKKANVRSYTKEYIKRGNIVKEPCYYCGNDKVEAHHHDYDKPLEVYWLCASCHRELHRNKELEKLIHSVPCTKVLKEVNIIIRHINA